MRAIGFYAPVSAWLFALIGPLVLFYFLKLKRPRYLVPSLTLWQQVLNDRRVNSPFQRFKRNLLLLLQILLLCALALGAMQPFWRTREKRITRVPVLIDCSASMAALDEAGGTSRLDVAREQVRQIIDGLLPDQELCLIAFGRTARKCTDFTGNKRMLRQALDAIRVEDVPSNIEDALRMAQALAQGRSIDEVLLFSDGNFPARAHFDLSFALNYQRLPPPGPNVGITSLNAKRWAEGRWDVFAMIEAAPGTTGAVAVDLRQDGEIAGSERVSVAGGASERIVFHVPGEQATSLEVRLMPEGFDALACDNTAFLELPAARSLRTYVAEGMHAYQHALAGLDAVSLVTAAAVTGVPDACDLVISDREQDLALDAATRLYVGLVPPDLRDLLTVEEKECAVVDWRRSSPILQHVEMTDLVIVDHPQLAEGAESTDLESRGYETLVYGDSGPLLLQKREGDRLTLLLLFHTDRSTLTYRVGFPVLVSNVVQAAMEQSGLVEVRAVQTGILPPLALDPNRSYVVHDPEGETRSVSTDATGMLSGVPARHVGAYAVSEGGRVRARLGAGLLSASETTLPCVDEIYFDEELSVEAAGAAPRTDRALWPTLALLGFCLLMGEWWYFHRRPGGLA